MTDPTIPAEVAPPAGIAQATSDKELADSLTEAQLGAILRAIRDYRGAWREVTDRDVFLAGAKRDAES